MFGCPHFTLEEAQHIAEGVKGKKLAIPMYILVSSHALQMAQRMGIADVLAEAAGHGVTCVLGGAQTRAAAEAHGWQTQELL